MAIYQYQTFYQSCFLLILFILFKQGSIVAITESRQYPSTGASNSRSVTTTLSTISFENNDDSMDDGEIENIEGEGEIYDDEGFGDNHAFSTTVSQSEFNNNMTSQINEETHMNEHDDEMDSYPEEDDDDEGENQIYPDTVSVNRPESQRPIIDSNVKKPLDFQSTSRMPFVASNLWRDLFAKPAILVGIIGGIVIGILSAILLIMFLIYRMRKKDEGSYALEEAPRKSPSHAYTRVSSREFFA